MPFLRVIRDKRGYETTYLIHWYREGTRQRSRILYVFRTPGGARVGREPLDPDVLRDIEAHHPEIVFDWKAVMDTRQVIETDPEPRRFRKRRGGEDDRAPVAQIRASPSPGSPSGGDPSAARRSQTPVPSAIEGVTPDEQIAFLTLWYPIVRDRVLQRISDPVRREALLTHAERLNPGAWTDADEIGAGLPQAAEALERLSSVLSRPRRRSRRSSTRSTSTHLHRPGVAASEVERVGSEVSAVEPPAVSAVEPPMVNAVEPSEGADGPTPGGSPPVALTDPPAPEE